MQIILRLSSDTNLGDVAARAYVLPNPDTNGAARARAASELARVNQRLLDLGRQALTARGVAPGDGLGGVPLGTILLAPALTGPDLPFNAAALGNRQHADGEVNVLQRALLDVTAAFNVDVAAESDAIVNTALRFNATIPAPLGKAVIDVAAAPGAGVAPPVGVPQPPALQAYEATDAGHANIRGNLVNKINRQAVLDRRVRLQSRITEFNARMTALQADMTALLNRFGA